MANDNNEECVLWKVIRYSKHEDEKKYGKNFLKIQSHTVT